MQCLAPEKNIIHSVAERRHRPNQLNAVSKMAIIT